MKTIFSLVPGGLRRTHFHCYNEPAGCFHFAAPIYLTTTVEEVCQSSRRSFDVLTGPQLPQ